MNIKDQGSRSDNCASITMGVTNAEKAKMMKIYFSVKDDCGVITAYAKLMTEAEVRAHYHGDSIVTGCLDAVKSFKFLRVENHSSDDVVSINIWGSLHPRCDLSDLQTHDGTKVEIDGVEVYNDLVHGDEANVGEHDSECTDCHK